MIKQMIVCMSETDDELEQCDICGEMVPSDDLTDTEGMVNGGIGIVCSQCLEDGDVKNL